MRRGWRWLMVLGLLVGLVPLLPLGVAVADDAVVGGLCDDDAFDAALATALTNGGGTITFNCGGATTITFTSEKTITAPNTVIIDGAGLITLDGGNATRLFMVESGAALELRNLTLSNGRAVDGGAIYSEDGSTLTIRSSTFTLNATTDFGDGGAIWTGATLVIESSVFADNIASGDAGAIDNDGVGSTTITDSRFIDNEALDGDSGAIDNETALTIVRSTFSGNVAFDEGGALWSSTDAPVTIERSTFTDNEADDDGGAINLSSGSMTIESSTFSGNYSDDEGGAIYTDGDMLTINNTTITGNEADDDGSGIYEDGGEVTFRNTIIADNVDDDCDGSFTSNDYNLDSDDTCDLDQPNDLPNNPNANLGALANNGGPTLTHLPQSGSDAIDNGPAACTSPDQRGQPRPSGPACDIGSVEVQLGSSTFALCVDRMTGRVLSPASGQCAPAQVALVVADFASLSFCIDPYTGIVHYLFGRPCSPPRQTHVVPANGDLLTCVNSYTRVNRKVTNHSQCLASERPNTISIPAP